ncbi:winged helix-turn-helix domain-containing protein [Ideonella livida]|uniref:Response regulator n=1 Tax=Ideonella livida TaxID=2707176 RepID=A0A7C9PK60_9BURK|nr:winged helix-turn-helix domain-containing protein [Ideonella livida]NDY94077.1 response regulator [Ideonella livida]
MRPPSPPPPHAPVLVVDALEPLATALRSPLAQAGVASHHLRRGQAVAAWAQAHHPALILLVHRPPGQDALALCRQLRAQGSAATVLLLSPASTEHDRLEGLAQGADDCLGAHLSHRELTARVLAHLRRHARLTGTALPDAPARPPATPPALRLDPQQHQALLNGQPVPLTCLEFQLLATLAGQPGRVFRRAQLMDAMYPDARDVSDRTVDSHIRKLRRKLAGLHPGRELIHALYGLGYTWDPAR